MFPAGGGGGTPPGGGGTPPPGGDGGYMVLGVRLEDGDCLKFGGLDGGALLKC